MAVSDEPPQWAIDLKDQLDRIENNVNALLTGQNTTEKSIKTRTVTKAINTRLKNEIVSKEGRVLFQHMMFGPDEDWNKKRDIGLDIQYEKISGKIASEVNKEGKVTISYTDGKLEKTKLVDSKKITVPSTWKFKILKDDFTKSIEDPAFKAIKKTYEKDSPINDTGIKTQINHVWQHILSKKEYEESKKWLKEWVDGRTLNNTTEKPSPKKAAPKKAAPKKSAPESTSEVESSDDE